MRCGHVECIVAGFSGGCNSGSSDLFVGKNMGGMAGVLAVAIFSRISVQLQTG